MAKSRSKSRSKSRPAAATTVSPLGIDPQWYKDAVIYQLHVRSFFDSDGNGVGDFSGLTHKLDYLQELGVTALWLLPFYPSPLRDDGYDIAEYTKVNPAYGSLRDFKRFIREAHARGLRVITELVVNHTSDQHPWFRRARLAAPGTPQRDFYVWSDTPEKYREARIIFKDFEVSNWAWDPVAKAYYWHRFYAHQPDLNFENPLVRQALFEVLDYWLGLGVDGLRLDAVPYLYEREGTNCENLPETHAFLRELRRRVDTQFPGRMLLAEANQWPEDAIAYFGAGDECHTAFHFPIMPRLFMAIHMEDRFPIVDILQQTPPIPPDCQWLIFLRNHDELTLEMVTDEERDYMYRVYARDRQARINLGIRRRLAPLLGNNRRKIELMNGLLCSLPGTPVIYYGDEIGMGDNIYLGDRDGVRTPMQWSPDRNAGFSAANPQRLYSPVIIDSEYFFETVNVETQQKNPSSLLWWMKRLVGVRQNYPALGRGSLEILSPENPKILAFTRDYQDQSVLVVANLSRFVQFVELDLTRFAGRRPRELFGQTPFPTIAKTPYALSLGPHAFYWFALEPEHGDAAAGDGKPARLVVPAGRPEWTRGRIRKNVEQLLAHELPKRRWFHRSASDIQTVQIAGAVELARAADGAHRILVVRVDFREGEAEYFLLPLGSAWNERAQQLLAESPHQILAELARAGAKDPAAREAGALYDASQDPATARELLSVIAERRRLGGTPGQLRGAATAGLSELLSDLGDSPTVNVRADGGDAVLVLGDHLALRLFHRLESGINPDLEIGHFLAQEHINLATVLPVLGSLEFRSADDESFTIGVLHPFVPHTTTGWQFVLDTLSRYFEHVMSLDAAARPTSALTPHGSLWELAQGDATPLAKDLLGGFLEWAALLGRRTAELHQALASDPTDPAFAPEPFSHLYQRSFYQSLRRLALQTFQRLRRRVSSLPAEEQAKAREVLQRERPVMDLLSGLLTKRLAMQRIRCHGNYQLEHVLYTGKDFLIVDFSGRSAISLPSRRSKRSALDDLAAMIHSLHRAALAALDRLPKLTSDAASVGRQAADFWHAWSSSAVLKAYTAATADSQLLSPKLEDLDLLLQVNLLEKALAALQSELQDARPHLAAALDRVLDLTTP